MASWAPPQSPAPCTIGACVSKAAASRGPAIPALRRSGRSQPRSWTASFCWPSIRLKSQRKSVFHQEITGLKIRNQATAIRLSDFRSAPMRTFHMSWLAFFLCFFGWFGLAPLMPVIRQELHLTREQIGNSIIASVAITVLARLLIGWLCDRVGPRRTYAWMLVLGALPVMGVGFAHDYTTFLLFRLAIGAIGASFVITQF